MTIMASDFSTPQSHEIKYRKSVLVNVGVSGMLCHLDLLTDTVDIMSDISAVYMFA